MRNAILFLALSLSLASCNVPFAPGGGGARPTASATALIPTLSLTGIASSTSEPTLAISPVPSNTPESALSPTPFFFFALPTKTPPGPEAKPLDCQLITQSLTDGAIFKASERFSMGWQVTNTGTATWLPAGVQFVYVGGAKLHISPVVNLTKSVGPGDVVALTVDMRAPKNSSMYTTFWSLRQGQDYFCRVSISVWVED